MCIIAKTRHYALHRTVVRYIVHSLSLTVFASPLLLYVTVNKG